MNFLIKQCLFPIIDGDECVGQGFVADGFYHSMYPEGEYNGCLIRWCSNPFPREESWTPGYFNKKAREQSEDAFG